MKFALPLLALLATGCGVKKIQTQLDTCSTELSACKEALEAAKAAKKPTLPFMDSRFEAYRELARQFREAFSDDGISIVLRDGRLVVQLPNQVLFESGKAMLSESGKKSLEKAAEILKKNAKRRFLVAGHTDNVPVAADGARFKDNWELSALRATTATKFLVSKGVAPAQVGAAGFGEFMPVSKNDTDEGKAKNRRLELIVFPTVDEMPKFPAKL